MKTRIMVTKDSAGKSRYSAQVYRLQFALTSVITFPYRVLMLIMRVIFIRYIDRTTPPLWIRMPFWKNVVEKNYAEFPYCIYVLSNTHHMPRYSKATAKQDIEKYFRHQAMDLEKNTERRLREQKKADTKRMYITLARDED